MSAQTGEQQQVSKGLLITLGVVAAIAAAVALWVFVVQPLIADDADPVAVEDEVDATEPDADLDPDPDADPAPNGEVDEPDEGDDPDDGDGGEAAPPETTEVVNARDPFQQLATDTSSGGATAGPGSGGTSTGDGTSTGGSDDDEDRADVGSTTVTLVDIYTGDDGLQRASVEVDETGYDVVEGDTFAENFQLLDIADDCATLLYGDSRFTLCEGDRVRK